MSQAFIEEAEVGAIKKNYREPEPVKEMYKNGFHDLDPRPFFEEPEPIAKYDVYVHHNFLHIKKYLILHCTY